MPKLEYEMVDSRLARFHADYPEGRVITELSHDDAARVVFKALIYLDESEIPAATGWAEETRGGKPPNDIFALEVAETSAIGRALANAGYAKTGARPSKEEMDKRDRVGLRVVEPPAHPSITKARQHLNDSSAELLDTEGIKDALNTLTPTAKEKAKAQIEEAGITLPLPPKITEPQMDLLEAALTNATA